MHARGSLIQNTSLHEELPLAVLLKGKETRMTDIFEGPREDYLPEGTFGGHLLGRTPATAIAIAIATVELCRRSRQTDLASLSDRTLMFNSVLHCRETWDIHRLTCQDHWT